jgi:hypothetical protein
LDQPCLLGGSAEDIAKELSEVSGVDYHDMLLVNLVSGWSTTCFLWPMETEHIFHIALGRHRIFAYINYDALFRKALEKGLIVEAIPKDLRGVKGFEREQLQGMSFPLPGLKEARGFGSAIQMVRRRSLCRAL